MPPLYHGYADDTQLYLRFNRRDPSNLLGAITKMEACLADLSELMVLSKLKPNPDNTEFIIFVMSHLQSLVDQLRPSLRVQDCIIQPSKCVRTLGRIFRYREMVMLPHVNQIVLGVYGKIKLINRIRRYLDESTCARAVQAVAISELDNANSLLAGLHQCALQNLHVSQHSAACLISIGHLGGLTLNPC